MVTHPPQAKEARTSFLLLALVFLSGTAALGYEIVWTRLFAVGIGHEFPSMLAVVAAFFGGLALGSRCFDRAVSRSRVPGRWFAACEGTIAAWGLISLWLVPRIQQPTAGWIGIEGSALHHWVVAFLVPFFTLLPATLAMGASFPAAERLHARQRRDGRSASGLYAANTAGAVAGVLVTTFWLTPSLGFRTTLCLLAALNGICALGVWFGPARGEKQRERVQFPMPGAPPLARLTWLALGTGFLGIGFQVLCVRVMGQTLENTIYTFACSLAVYLTGTTLGAAAYQRFFRRVGFDRTARGLLMGLALACFLAVPTLHRAKLVYESTREALGGGMTGSLVAEVLLAALVLGPATVLMGLTFGHWIQAGRQADGGVGRTLAWNTLGSCLAPPIFGIVLLPALGAKWSLVLAATGYLVLIPGHRFDQRLGLGMLAWALMILVLPGQLRQLSLGHARLIHYDEGMMASVAVLESNPGDRTLKVNDRFSMGSTGKSFGDRRQAHLPILLHSEPSTALFLGVGTGITAGAATVHEELRVDAVELLPEVLETLPYFEVAHQLSQAKGRFEMFCADARRFVRCTDRRYDVVVADLFHPGRDGAGLLFTREHFQAIRQILEPGGLFCQWLPVYQLDLGMLRLIARTFADVFPHAEATLVYFNIETPLLGLLGSETPRRYHPDWFESRVGSQQALRQDLLYRAMTNDNDLFGCLLASDQSVREFGGMGPLNTDDHPRVLFQAPRYTYSKVERPSVRLRGLLAECQLDLDSLFPTEAADRVEEISAYIDARDQYFESLFVVQSGTGNGVEELRNSVRASAEFTTSYVMLLQRADQRARTAPAESQEILHFLQQTVPDDPRALELQRQLFGR